MPETIDMRQQSDEDLFLYMSFFSNPPDRAVAEAAFAELHRRYAAELRTRCGNLCHRLGQDSSFTDDLVSLTLTRALDRAETYKGSSSPSRTMAWLCTIARNALIDSLRNPHRANDLNGGSSVDLGAEAYSPQDFANLYHQFEHPLASSQQWVLVADAFQELDARAQRILLETLLQRSRSPGHSYMFRGTASMLAKNLGMTPDNVRRIRMNSLKAIDQKLQRSVRDRGTPHVTTR